MQKQKLFNILEALPFFALAAIARTLPRIPALKFGRVLGRLSQWVQPKRVKTAFDNLQRAYPDQDKAWINQQIRLNFEHLGISGMEMLRLNKFSTQQDLDENFTIEGQEHLDQLKKNNSGAFLLSAHIGFWEVGSFVIPKLGFPCDFVAKTIRNPYVDQFFLQQRQANGAHCIDSKKGARRIIKSLASKRFVGLLLDQHISKKQAVIVDFFNRPAYATPIIPQIALKNNTPIVPIFIYRNDDFSYRVVIEPPLVFTEKSTPESIQQCTQKLTDTIESAVRKHPTQWFWVHRRWRKSAEKK